MKVMLTFALPDEELEYRHASKGAVYHDVLTELAAAFRAHRKYDGPAVTEDNFYSILDDLGVSVE
jgi:hypothetical protein